MGAAEEGLERQGVDQQSLQRPHSGQPSRCTPHCLPNKTDQVASNGQGTIRDAPPETDVEQMRKAAQKLYLEEQKYWKDNAALIEQQIEEDKQRQIKECVFALHYWLDSGAMGVPLIVADYRLLLSRRTECLRRWSV